MVDTEREINAVLQQRISEVSEDHMNVIRKLLTRDMRNGNYLGSWLLWDAVLIFHYGMICGKRAERARRKSRKER